MTVYAEPSGFDEFVSEAPETNITYQKVYEFLPKLNVDRNHLVVDISQIEFEESRVKVDHRNDTYKFALDNSAKRLFSKLFKINPTFVKNSPDDLASYVLQYYLDHQDADVELVLRYSVPDIGDWLHLDSVEQSIDNAIPVEEVLDEFLKNFDDNDLIESYATGPDLTSLSVLVASSELEISGDGTEHRPRSGDKYQYGVNISIETGKTPRLSLRPFVYRLMNTALVYLPYHREVPASGLDIESLIHEMNALTKEVLSFDRKVMQSLGSAGNITPPQEDLGGAVRHLMKESKIGSRVQEAAEDQVIIVGDKKNLTVLDVVLIISSIANRILAVASQEKAQKLAGDILDDNSLITDRCKTCHQMLEH